MSVSVMSAVFECSQASLGSRLVLLAIADCANDEDWQAWPSVAKVAQKARLSERQTHYAIANLIKLGELKVHRNQGPKGCNLYRVLVGEGGAVDCTGANIAGVQSTTARGAIYDTKGVQPIAPKPSLEPSKNHHVPPKVPQGGRRAAHKKVPLSNPEFDEFWNAIPNGIGKGKAREAWEKATRNGTSAKEIMDGVPSYHAYERRRSIQHDYRPLHPATWLNQRRWEDEGNDYEQK